MFILVYKRKKNCVNGTFWKNFLYNSISTFLGYLMPNPSCTNKTLEQKYILWLSSMKLLLSDTTLWS